MKTLQIVLSRETGTRACRVFKGGMAAVLVALIGSYGGVGIGMSQEIDNDVKGVQVLTRGPVHEAFAGIVSYNPVPGVVVQKAPPEDIEEIPPDDRPEGENMTWIPGYWGWDDERNDYLWVSGTWRTLPPGRQWMAGYWGNTSQGHQWTSGYWADASLQETTYLPAPPATLEEGPSTRAPSRDYGWTPGNWMWSQNRYAWSSGYWAQGREDWDWMPAHYVSTPRGHIYVDGYWDYPVRRRGMLFAPVYFDSGLYSQPGYRYSPSIVLDLAVFVEHLFLRPKYHHYYFGDYYAPHYNHGGIYTAMTYQNNRYGYDPIFSHQRWEHRQDQNWEQRWQANFRYRSDHENARPPHTWSEMRKIDANSAESKQNGMLVAAPMHQLVKRKDSPLRFRPVVKEDRDMIGQRSQAMRTTSNERRSLEAKSADRAVNPKPGEEAVVTKVKLPRSPIVARSVSQFDKNQAPPAVQRAPKIESLDQPPKPATSDRQPMVDKNKPQPEARQPDSEKPLIPGKPQVAPREQRALPDRPKNGREKQVEPTKDSRGKQAADKVQEQPSRERESPARTPGNEDKKMPPAREPARVKESSENPPPPPARVPDDRGKKMPPEPRVKKSPEKPQEQPARKSPNSAPQPEPRTSGKEEASSPPADDKEQTAEKERKTRSRAR